MNKQTSPRRLAVAALAVVSLGLAACGSDDDAAPATDPAPADTAPADTAAPADSAPETTETGGVAEATFPVTVEHVYGETVIDEQPQEIVAASATTTGHLLGIGAPVKAAMTLPPDGPLTDENGFMKQWADVAVAEGVVAIPGGPQVNIESVAAEAPDLIVGASYGQDAITEEQYELLSQIAPTVVYDFSGMSWQEFAETLGVATGLEDEAAASIDEFDAHIAELTPTIDTSNEIVAGVFSPESVNVFTSESAHGELIDALGLTLHTIDGETFGNSQGGQTRTDAVNLSPELIADAIGDSTVLFVFGDQAAIDSALSTYPTLAATPAAAEGRLVPLGPESFRLDRYSATLTADRIAEALAAG